MLVRTGLLSPHARRAVGFWRLLFKQSTLGKHAACIVSARERLRLPRRETGAEE